MFVRELNEEGFETVLYNKHRKLMITGLTGHHEDCADGCRKAFPGPVYCWDLVKREIQLEKRVEWSVLHSRIHGHVQERDSQIQNDLCVWPRYEPRFPSQV